MSDALAACIESLAVEAYSLLPRLPTFEKHFVAIELRHRTIRAISGLSVSRAVIGAVDAELKAMWADECSTDRRYAAEKRRLADELKADLAA